MNFVLAAKCAPQEKLLTSIEKAEIQAVELYLSKEILKDYKTIISVCKKYPFRYAVHAPNDCFCPEILRDFVNEIQGEILNFHDIFWDDEWALLIDIFKGTKTKLCVENLGSVFDSAKFMRRYGFGRCLDVEHMQFEISGVFEEEFINVMKESSHIHLTGYTCGSQLWHTHLHHSPQHTSYLLDLINKSGYSGLVVSEARVSLQTDEEFKKLKEFFNQWASKENLKI